MYSQFQYFYLLCVAVPKRSNLKVLTVFNLLFSWHSTPEASFLVNIYVFEKL